MVDECPMIEDCPAYDRGRGMCLVAPGDCEFSPPDPEAAGPLEALTHDEDDLDHRLTRFP